MVVGVKTIAHYSPKLVHMLHGITEEMLQSREALIENGLIFDGEKPAYSATPANGDIFGRHNTISLDEINHRKAEYFGDSLPRPIGILTDAALNAAQERRGRKNYESHMHRLSMLAGGVSYPPEHPLSALYDPRYHLLEFEGNQGNATPKGDFVLIDGLQIDGGLEIIKATLDPTAARIGREATRLAAHELDPTSKWEDYNIDKKPGVVAAVTEGGRLIHRSDEAGDEYVMGLWMRARKYRTSILLPGRTLPDGSPARIHVREVFSLIVRLDEEADHDSIHPYHISRNTGSELGSRIMAETIHAIRNDEVGSRPYILDVTDTAYGHVISTPQNTARG